MGSNYGVFYFILGQGLGQYGYVVRKLFLRMKYLNLYVKIALKRGFILWRGQLNKYGLYVYWLLLGSNKYNKGFFRYYKGIEDFCFHIIKVIILMIGFVYGLQNKEIFIQKVYLLFQNPEISAKGFLGYTVVVSTLFIWILEMLLLYSSKKVRNIIEGENKKILNRYLVLNIVIFLILISLGAQNGRDFLGLRVWYSSVREYSGRLGTEYWDW